MYDGAANRGWLGNALVFIAYALLAHGVSAYFARYGLFPAPNWPPASVALAAAFFGGARLAPGIFLGAFYANFVLFDASFAVAFGIGIGNTLGPLIGAHLMRRFIEHAEPFESLRDLGHFIIFGVLIHAAITAGGGALSLHWGAELPWSAVSGVWRGWFLSDAGGVMLFAPMLLLWLNNRGCGMSRRCLTECLGLTLMLAVLSVWVFFGEPGWGLQQVVLGYLLTPLMIWGALRFRQRSAAGWVALIALIATAGTIEGYGPFAQEAAPLQALWLMIVIFGLTVLSVGALVAERRRAEGELRAARDNLEQQVELRVEDLRHELEERKRIEAELQKLATTDSLTGIANRRAFLERTEEAVALAVRQGSPLSLLIFDLDNFKRINDTEGHHMGDEVIRAVVRAVNQRLRESDIFGRVGGEEFAVTLPFTDQAGAAVVAEQLRAAVEECASDCSLPTTISIGVVERQAGEGLEPMLQRGDLALYGAKAGGRNRVVAAPALP